MKKTLDWLYENWMKSTPVLAIYSFILIWIYVKDVNFALSLIWLQCTAYWLHEFEEYICPGGFLSFFNQKALGSTIPEKPLTKAGSFWINIPLMYVLLPLSGILSQRYGLQWGLWTAYYSTLNASSHVVMFFLYRKYNPGLVVSSFINVPLGIFTIYYFLSNNIISTQANIISIIVGVIAMLSMMIYGFAYLVPKSKREGYHKA